MDKTSSDQHLSDAELFGLAAPAAGEPEALPAHVLQCAACSRSLRDWKTAMRELAEDEISELNLRTPEQWRAAEDATMASIRGAARPARSRRPLRWALALAASLLIAVLAMPRRSAPAVASTGSRAPAAAALSASDQEDDALLRDAAYLAQGGDDNLDTALEERL